MLFSIDTAACDASALMISTVAWSYEMTSRSVTSGEDSMTSALRLRFSSCSTPTTSSRCERIGITSIDLER
jgi:hypothetical protein